MRYTKYLVFVLLLMLFGINTIHAEECLYQNEDVSLEYNSTTNKFTIRQRQNKKEIVADNEPLINKYDAYSDGFTNIRVEKISTTCPNYVVYRRKVRALWWDSDGIWGFNTQAAAQEFANASEKKNNLYAWIPSRFYGTREQFENNIDVNIANANMRKDTDYNTNGNYGTTGVETSDEIMSCGELFDPSIIELLNDILKYPRYIVPGIILVLGSVDFFKAVIAGKEDEMKMAQKTFIKRVIIGVCVFLVPVFVNAIAWLANIAWQGLGYSTPCGL